MCTISLWHGVVPAIGGHCVDGLCPGSQDSSFHVKEMFPFAASFGSSPIETIELSVTDPYGVIGHYFPRVQGFHQRLAL